jgi:hypothetical protein
MPRSAFRCAQCPARSFRVLLSLAFGPLDQVPRSCHEPALQCLKSPQRPRAKLLEVDAAQSQGEHGA